MASGDSSKQGEKRALPLPTGPPELPLVQLSEHDFEDLPGFLDARKELGEKHGAIKVVPPDGWKARATYEGCDTLFRCCASQTAEGEDGLYELQLEDAGSMYMSDIERIFGESEAEREPRWPSNVRAAEIDFWRNVGMGDASTVYTAQSANSSLFEKSTRLWNLNSLRRQHKGKDGKGGGAALGSAKASAQGALGLGMGMAGTARGWAVSNGPCYTLAYLHKGASRTIYVVSPAHRQVFETLVHSLQAQRVEDDEAPAPVDLKDASLLVDPTVLSKHKISLSKTTQQAGEFVVIWPASYHSSFSHGINCFEAVECLPQACDAKGDTEGGGAQANGSQASKAGDSHRNVSVKLEGAAHGPGGAAVAAGLPAAPPESPRGKDTAEGGAAGTATLPWGVLAPPMCNSAFLQASLSRHLGASGAGVVGSVGGGGTAASSGQEDKALPSVSVRALADASRPEGKQDSSSRKRPRPAEVGEDDGGVAGESLAQDAAAPGAGPSQKKHLKDSGLLADGAGLGGGAGVMAAGMAVSPSPSMLAVQQMAAMQQMQQMAAHKHADGSARTAADGGSQSMLAMQQMAVMQMAGMNQLNQPFLPQLLSPGGGGMHPAMLHHMAGAQFAGMNALAMQAALAAKGDVAGKANGLSQGATDSVDKNKNCHFCEHAPKRCAIFSCCDPVCDQMFCENCCKRHLGRPTSFKGQQDANEADWRCPICTKQCCCTLAVCTKNHLHCKRYRRKMKISARKGGEGLMDTPRPCQQRGRPHSAGPDSSFMRASGLETPTEQEAAGGLMELSHRAPSPMGSSASDRRRREPYSLKVEGFSGMDDWVATRTSSSWGFHSAGPLGSLNQPQSVAGTPSSAVSVVRPCLWCACGLCVVCYEAVLSRSWRTHLAALSRRYAMTRTSVSYVCVLLFLFACCAAARC